jgi:hypothetical protein
MTWWRSQKPIEGCRMKEEEETNIKCTMYFVKVATNYKD